MKYIDSEKLIAEIERYENTAIEAYNPLGEDADFWHGRVVTCEDLKTFITSLQQEQPMPDSTKLIEFWNETKEMLKEKDFRDDAWRLAYNAFMCGFVRGVSVKKQEQPEMDLDKLVNEEFASHSQTTEYGLEVTYNRAELYQLIKRMALVFNARKEN